MPRIASICAALGGTSEVRPVSVAHDCSDGFAKAFYARPERFLDPDVRNAQSWWSFVPATTTRRGLGKLQADLDSGAWDERYGGLRHQPEFDGALRLIIAHR